MARKHVFPQRGFTLIELMIALLIGLFLMGALLIVVQNNKRTFTTQNVLARLQDNQRLAMTLLTDAIQQAGYFPDPTTNTANALFNPAVSSQFAVAGQFLNGTYSAAAPGDSISVFFANASGDGMLNCLGQSNTSGSSTPSMVGERFYIQTSGGGVGQLSCDIGFQSGNSAIQLVGDGNYVKTQPINLSMLRFLYGVNSAGTGTNVDTYKNASQMTATDWLNVISVQITVTFTNPLYSLAGQGNQPQTIAFTRVVAIMRKTGVS